MLNNKIIKNFFSFFFIINFIINIFFNVLPILAQENTNNDNYGLDTSAKEVKAYNISSYNNNFLSTKIGSILGVALSFVGVVFLILMIFAGLTWMTASGNQEKVNKAKDLMINAIIGLIIVMAAYAITAFVGERLTNTY